MAGIEAVVVDAAVSLVQPRPVAIRRTQLEIEEWQSPRLAGHEMPPRNNGGFQAL